MPSFPVNPETIALASRLIWFEPPETALQQAERLLAYAFARATCADMQIIDRYVTTTELRHALRHAPPGIIDARSWAYWHLMLDLGEAPTLPERQLD